VACHLSPSNDVTFFSIDSLAGRLLGERSLFWAIPMRRHFGILKTTLLGGVLFLLPVLVIGALLGQVLPIAIGVAESIWGHIPLQTPRGVALLGVTALLLLVLVCFSAGLLARVSFGRRWSNWLENKLLLLMPRYAIVRNLLAEKVGTEGAIAQMKPVLVRLTAEVRLGFETDRVEGHAAVYLPGAPDTWSGHWAIVDARAVTPLAMEFSKAVGFCERMGRESLAELASPLTSTMRQNSSVDAQKPPTRPPADNQQYS
jgi:uncharacterized membrane protein